MIVHPECPAAVVDAADGAGSTEYIRKEIEAAAPGSVIAVGTEINLVNRLQQQRPDLTIFCLDPVVCPCSTMYRIHPAYLAWTLESLVAGETPNQIRVPEIGRGRLTCGARTDARGPAMILVVGAGVAGLTCALEAVASGAEVELVTRATQPER